MTERLRRAILDAEFSLGEALSEDKLATALGVSRTPVREALTALQQQGLIDIQPQRGSFVFLPSESDLVQLCEFRRMVEVQALRLCFLHRREVTLEEMVEANRQMEAAARSGDHLASARADGAFHDALLANCTNDYLASAYRLASGKVAALRAHRSSPDTRVEVNTEHGRLLDAISRGDLTHAEVILSEHIFKMIDRFGRDGGPPSGEPTRRVWADVTPLGPLAEA